MNKKCNLRNWSAVGPFGFIGVSVGDHLLEIPARLFIILSSTTFCCNSIAIFYRENDTKRELSTSKIEF